MGLKKKLKTTFTRKTNSRKEKRKEAKKRSRTLQGSNVSLSIADVYDQLYEEHETGKQTPVPLSETRLPGSRPNDKFQDIETSELQIIPSHNAEVAQKRPRTARVLTCPGNLPAPTRTQTRMRFRDDDDDGIDMISSCSSASEISIKSFHSDSTISPHVTIVAPFTPRFSRMGHGGFDGPIMPRADIFLPPKMENDISLEDLDSYSHDGDVEPHIPKCRAPPQEDLYFMYKKLLTDPFRNTKPVIDLRPTTSSLSLISSDTVFDWPVRERFEVPYVEPTKLPPIGYGFHHANTRQENMVGRLNRFQTDRESLRNQPLKFPSIIQMNNLNAQLRTMSRSSTACSGSINDSYSRSSSRSSYSSARSKGQTAQSYINNIKENQCTWTKNEQINLKGEKRIRRKLLDGAYPNSTVKEDKLPTLLRFVWKGKHKKLKNYLNDASKHKKINRTDKFGRTALHFAASWADYRMLKILLDVRGIDVNIKDQHHKTPLFKAIDMKSLACVRLLVHAGAKARVTCSDERNALEYALTEYGDDAFEIIDFFYNGRGIRDIDMGSNGMSLLHQAVVTKKHVTNVKVIKMILEPGLVDVNAVEGDKRTPLILAAQSKRPDLLLALLENGADPKHYDSFMKNAICYTEKDSTCYKILQGFKVNKKTGKRIFKYRPDGQLATVQAINVKAKDNNQRGSTPPKQKGQKDAPYNINPKMDDPEYRAHITSLFTASKFKEPKREDLYYDPLSI
ncbi:uncharacterized protein [Clytia hemisphaerica]|uniref:Uncharacterized protein n=1 Tax=Clytia hemisphaerica TaxID=252671 RepID=A0A7M5UQL2_9CNID